MKITSTKKIKQSIDLSNIVKSTIRIRKNQKNFLIKTTLAISILNSILLGLVLTNSWEKLVLWLQKIL